MPKNRKRETHVHGNVETFAQIENVGGDVVIHAAPPPVADLRLVDVIFDKEPIWGFPIMDIKVRNAGTDTAFIKRAEFEILKIGKPENPRDAKYKAVSASGNYDVRLSPDLEGETIAVNLSQAVEPKSVDRFTLSIANKGTKDGELKKEIDVPVYYYARFTLVYNEENRVGLEQPIVLSVPSAYRSEAAYVAGINRETIARNQQVASEFMRLNGYRNPDFQTAIYNFEYESRHGTISQEDFRILGLLGDAGNFLSNQQAFWVAGALLTHPNPKEILSEIVQHRPMRDIVTLYFALPFGLASLLKEKEKEGSEEAGSWSKETLSSNFRLANSSFMQNEHFRKAIESLLNSPATRTAEISQRFSLTPQTLMSFLDDPDSTVLDMDIAMAITSTAAFASGDQVLADFTSRQRKALFMLTLSTDFARIQQKAGVSIIENRIGVSNPPP